MTPPARTAAAAPVQTAAPAETGAPAAPAATPTSPVGPAASVAAAATPAPSATAISTGSDVSAQFDQRAADDALAYWTPERMAAAKPLPLPSRNEARPPSAPVREPAAASATADLQAGTGGGGSTAEVPRPYTSAPARTEVRIFFKKDGKDHLCSGTVVNSRSKRMVDTAGHCVSDAHGHYFSDFKVVPAYSSRCSGCEDAPYGEWSARTVTTRAEWHFHENYRQDLGYIVTNDRNGRRIADVVGGVGTEFNIGRDQRWAATGYPAEEPFNGYDQYVSVSGRIATTTRIRGRVR